MGRFDICNYDYICDTNKEREEAKFNFFVMSCIGTSTVGEAIPQNMMIDETGREVDRKGLNTFVELIKECNSFFEKIGEKKYIETLHISLELPALNKKELKNKITNAYTQSGASDIELLQLTFFDSSKNKKGEQPYKCVYDANKEHVKKLCKNKGVYSKTDTFEKEKISEAVVTLSYALYKKQYFENIEYNFSNIGIKVLGYIETTSFYDNYEKQKKEHISCLKNDNQLEGKVLDYDL